MEKLAALLDGKKTYFTVFGIFVAGGLQALGYELPSWVWTMLGGASAGSLRLAIAKIEKN
ncbi:hypothetical protein [Methylocystis sp. S23]